MMTEFFRGPDRSVFVRLGPEWPGFNEALSDAVSSLPPRGSDERTLSTYWIDLALRATAGVPPERIDHPFVNGNTTSLYYDGIVVRAASDYELFDDEIMPVEQFREVLQAWRNEVVRVRSAEEIEIPGPTDEIPCLTEAERSTTAWPGRHARASGGQNESSLVPTV